MTTRNEQKAKTRQRLIAVALKLSAERGFGAVSLREVAKGAGIAPTGFYRHFKSMEDLGLILVDEVGSGLRKVLRDVRKNYINKPGAIKACIQAFIDFVGENQNLYRVFLGERQGSSEVFRRALRNELVRFVEELSQAIEEKSKIYQVPVRDIGLVATGVVSIVFTESAEVLDMPRHEREKLCDKIVRQIEMLFRGARE